MDINKLKKNESDRFITSYRVWQNETAYTFRTKEGIDYNVIVNKNNEDRYE